MSTFSNFPRPVILSIEGNIGAGKTTIIEKMKDRLRSDEIVFVKEPVDQWEHFRDSSDGENILMKFYADQTRHAFTFQVLAYTTRLALLRKTVRENPCAKVIVCERSLDADRNIFAKMLRDSGKMSDIEFQIYDHFFSEYSEKDEFRISPQSPPTELGHYQRYNLDGVIYIDADPEICSGRIKKRSREGESGIPVDYLKSCREYHENWLLRGKDLGKCKVLHIITDEDATYDPLNNDDCGNRWIRQIEDFIGKLQK
jgi:deoxyadenosine/deoxycytidine kinase